MRQLRADQLGKCQAGLDWAKDNIKVLEEKLAELNDVTGQFNDDLDAAKQDADKELLKKIEELLQKLAGWKGEGDLIEGEKENLKKDLDGIDQKIKAQDRSKVDMQTIRLILSDIDSINNKTLGYIDEVEELIKKVNAAFDDWRKFAEENGEKNQLVSELSDLLDEIGNRYDELKRKHAVSHDKSNKLKEVYSS